MYELGPPGVRSAGSTLKFFKTHHLKCSLQVSLMCKFISLHQNKTKQFR